MSDSLICTITCFGAYHVWFTDTHNNMFWCLCIFHGQSRQEPASTATDDELGDPFHFSPQAHTGSCSSQINNNYKSRERIWKQGLSPCIVVFPVVCLYSVVAVLLSVLYILFFALGLVISNRIPTHLVWLQWVQWYWKYRTDIHSLSGTKNIGLTYIQSSFEPSLWLWPQTW